MEAMERMMTAEEYAFNENVRFHIVNKYTAQCSNARVLVRRTYCDIISADLVTSQCISQNSPVVATRACHPRAASHPTVYDKNLLCERGANSDTQSTLISSAIPYLYS
jgi:hypothetical protein